MAWMLRDFNPGCEYYNDFKFFNFVGCTYAMYRQLASEGFRGQKYSLEYAQETLLHIESNKVARNKKLVEQGLLKKHIAHDTLVKLCGSEEAVKEYIASSKLTIEEDDEEQG